MSLVIQKKKLSKSNPSVCTKHLSAFGPNDLIFQKYFKTLDELEINFRKQYFQRNYKNLRPILDNFYKSLKNDQHFITDLSKHGDELADSPANMFLIRKVAGVVETLSEYVIEKKDKQPKEQQEVNLICIKILKVFAMLNPNFAQILANKPTFLEKMFELMLEDNKIYFKQALYIQEALIAAKSGTLNKEVYPIMSEIMSNMSKKYFARFSRIIALVVLENSDKMDFRELPCDYVDNKMIRIHSYLLSIPNFILTYVQILEHLKDIMESLISTTPENVQKTIKYLKESNLIKDSGINLSFLKPLFDHYQVSDNIVSEIFTPKFILRFIVKKSNITEILFVLSNILSGKRKIDVQNILTEINFLERVLEPLLDILFHPDLELDNPEDMVNNESCHCSNPLATTRIQLLRVIINLCDRDTANTHSKDLFISHEEKKILYRQLIPKAFKAHHFDYQEVNSSDLINFIDQMIFAPQDPESPFFTEEIMKSNIFEHVTDKGLLHKIIILLGKSHPNSNYRFWLASCVESFLRGFHRVHQIFVAHTGLIYELLDKILNKKTTKSNNIQISYDLIGEIIKFNKYNVIFLEKICEKFGWLKLLPYHASQNIIDSNVFLRGLHLSFQKFDYIYEKEKNEYLREHVYNFGKTSQLYLNFTNDNFMWFNLLIESVEPNIINQDNICCVNTALIMAIFAEQKGLLNQYFMSLLIPKPAKSIKEILEKFSKVLSIWQRYYMSKTKDSYSLKYTSALPFHYYQDMKGKLQTFVDKSIASLNAEEQ